MWQCDFFSKHVVTAEGVIRQCFVLAFVHVQTRRVWLSPCSFKPDAVRMTEQAQGFLAHTKSEQLPAEVLLRDYDGKYTAAAFDDPLAAAGVTVKQVGFRSPNLNAYAERFVQAIELECPDKFVVFGREHLDLICREYAEHYHTERPHQGVGNATLITAGGPVVETGEVLSRERLGGVLRHYYRAA